jgi:hypothetical protein
MMEDIEDELTIGMTFNQYNFLHNINGPAIDLSVVDNCFLFSKDEIFWINGVCYPTVQEWGCALVKSGNKTKEEAALLVLKWS